MIQTVNTYGKKWGTVFYLISRNVFLLVNGIVFSVVGLLLFFGDIKEGVFLGIILLINTVVSIIRDIRTWSTLEKLQILTSVRVVVINEDGQESSILPEEIQAGYRIKLKLGDQVPCDGKLLSVSGLEVNEGVLTGESKSFLRKEGETVFAGSIVTSGSGILVTETTFNESRIAKMTGNIKRYSNTTSPIQRSVNMVVKYSGYILIVLLFFVIYLGLSAGDPYVLIVKRIGAVASMTIPQGLVIATTLMFIYGAIYSFRRNVLLQDINATEKFGRIKNLCIDKTGTLTENELTVENFYIPDRVSKDIARKLASLYVLKSGDSSETIVAIKNYLNEESNVGVIKAMPFSASRRYGAVLLDGEYANTVVFAGAPETFIPSLSNSNEKKWVEDIIKTNVLTGHRVICFVSCNSKEIPEDISRVKFEVLGIFILHNNLREGTVEAIKFFQDRGVSMRVISGDNLETVKFIAHLAGVKGTDLFITGPEMDKWSEDEFRANVKKYNIFARIKPEQKEKIIESMKIDGFTAMVGDGANDALAIKKADLGIAMFDGAQATRQLASVILMNNSFSELPSGVKLADNVIENIEILASIFLNQTFLGFFLFLFVSMSGYPYPFTPLNVTFINYFTIGIPSVLIFYWLTRPREVENIVNNKTFLSRIIPFSLVSATSQLIGVIFLFIFFNKYYKDIVINTPIVLSFILLGIIFFFAIQMVYKTTDKNKRRIKELAILVVAEIAFLTLGFSVPFFNNVYNIVPPSREVIGVIGLGAFIFIFIQYMVTGLFIKGSSVMNFVHNKNTA